MEPSPAQRAARDQIAAQLAQAGFALPGTLTVRAYACGKPGCRCHADPPRLHGPYAEWTRKIGGKTITRRLTPRQLAEYQPLFDNAKKLRALLSELQDLTLDIVEAGSGAQVSELHCNFLINLGSACAADIEMLGETVRKRVKENSGIELDWEIKRIGCA